MWLKVLVGALVIAFCTFLGYFAASKYRARRQFYADFSAFNEKYLAELKYARRPIGELLAESGTKGDFGKALEAYGRTRKPEIACSYLTAEEREEAKGYFSMLGRGDARAQSGYFSAQAQPLAEKKKAAEGEAKARGELYLKLGLLAGLAFVILIV